VKGALDIAHHERRINPNDVIAGTLERGIAAGIGAAAFGVIRAIDLNNETLRGSQEVRNEAA